MQGAVVFLSWMFVSPPVLSLRVMPSFPVRKARQSCCCNELRLCGGGDSDLSVNVIQSSASISIGFLKHVRRSLAKYFSSSSGVLRLQYSGTSRAVLCRSVAGCVPAACHRIGEGQGEKAVMGESVCLCPPQSCRTPPYRMSSRFSPHAGSISHHMSPSVTTGCVTTAGTSCPRWQPPL